MDDGGHGHVMCMQYVWAQVCRCAGVQVRVHVRVYAVCGGACVRVRVRVRVYTSECLFEQEQERRIHIVRCYVHQQIFRLKLC